MMVMLNQQKAKAEGQNVSFPVCCTGQATSSETEGTDELSKLTMTVGAKMSVGSVKET
jgi:hypothetical protein